MRLHIILNFILGDLSNQFLLKVLVVLLRMIHGGRYYFNVIINFESISLENLVQVDYFSVRRFVFEYNQYNAKSSLEWQLKRILYGAFSCTGLNFKF